MNENIKILFFCRKNCNFSKKMFQELKKNFKKITRVVSTEPNKKIPKKIHKWKGHYILSFRSFYILPIKLIKQAKFAAINFHPGTPKYRGIGCVNFAILNSEKVYGSTCHLMAKRIDNGKIIDVRKFNIKKNDNIKIILKRSYNFQFKQFKKIINKIKSNNFNLNLMIKKSKQDKWSKKIYNREDLNKLYKLNSLVKSNDLKKYLRATLINKFRPYFEIDGKKYFLNYEKK